MNKHVRTQTVCAVLSAIVVFLLIGLSAFGSTSMVSSQDPFTPTVGDQPAGEAQQGTYSLELSGHCKYGEVGYENFFGSYFHIQNNSSFPVSVTYVVVDGSGTQIDTDTRHMGPEDPTNFEDTAEIFLAGVYGPLTLNVDGQSYTLNCEPPKTETPTDVPTEEPTEEWTPTDEPTEQPTDNPTDEPTETVTPEVTPTEDVTEEPTPEETLTEEPTETAEPPKILLGAVCLTTTHAQVSIENTGTAQNYVGGYTLSSPDETKDGIFTFTPQDSIVVLDVFMSIPGDVKLEVENQIAEVDSSTCRSLTPPPTVTPTPEVIRVFAGCEADNTAFFNIQNMSDVEVSVKYILTYLGQTEGPIEITLEPFADGEGGDHAVIHPSIPGVTGKVIITVFVFGDGGPVTTSALVTCVQPPTVTPPPPTPTPTDEPEIVAEEVGGAEGSGVCEEPLIAVDESEDGEVFIVSAGELSGLNLSQDPESYDHSPSMNPMSSDKMVQVVYQKNAVDANGDPLHPEIWLANAYDGEVYHVSFGPGERPSFNPYGRYIQYILDGVVIVRNVVDTNEEPIEVVRGDFATWSPDGYHVTVYQSRSRRIIEVNTAGDSFGAVETLVRFGPGSPGAVSELVWNYHRTHLAVVNGGHIYLYDTATGSYSLFQYRAVHPTFNRSGLLVFASITGVSFPDWNIYVYKLETDEWWQVVNARQTNQPVWWCETTIVFTGMVNDEDTARTEIFAVPFTETLSQPYTAQQWQVLTDTVRDAGVGANSLLGEAPRSSSETVGVNRFDVQ